MRQIQGKTSPYLTLPDRQKIKANDGLFQFCDVIIQRPDHQAISLIQENLLVEVGQISTEFEDRYSEFTVSSVSIKVSNFTNQLDLNNPDSYFYKLSKDEIVSVAIYLQMEKNYAIFKGILSQTESTFNIDSDEGTLYAEGEIKKFSNVSAEGMWEEGDKHRFKHVVDVVNKCVEEMATETAQSIQSIINEPSLTSEERTFSYYDRIDPDETVQSIAVDEDGILYLMTEKKIYSFNPATREKKLIYGQSSSLYKNHKMVYYDGYILFVGEWLDEEDIGTIYRMKKDGTELTYLHAFPLPTINNVFTSRQYDYFRGAPLLEEGQRYRFYAFQLIGEFVDMTHKRYSGQQVYLDKLMYVDFAYIEGESDPVGTHDPFSFPGGYPFPTSEYKIRVFKNYTAEGYNIQQYCGCLPMYLSPGTYSFISYPCSEDFNFETAYVTGPWILPWQNLYYSKWNPNDVPRKFTISIKEDVDFCFTICNGFLIYPKRQTSYLWFNPNDPRISLEAINPLDASQRWDIDLKVECINEKIGFSVDGAHIFLAYKSKDANYIEEMIINGYDNVTKVKTENVLNDAKVAVKEIVRYGNKNACIFEYNDLPNFVQTIHTIGSLVNPEKLDPDLINPNSGQQYLPADDLPCHAVYSSLIQGIGFLNYAIPTDWWFVVGLPGDMRDEKSQFNQIDYFSDDDYILIVPSAGDANIYRWQISRAMEVLFDSEQNIYLITRTRLKGSFFENFSSQVTADAKIYKSAGKLPPLRFVKAGESVRYNYTLVEKEEKTIEAYTLREKAEPIKLTNKYAVIDASFKITFENGKEIPSSDYEIQENKGTDYDETWIYFGPVYFGKKILVTYNYVDPEKKFLSLIVAHNKVYFVETSSAGAKLISYDGTQFKEEGLTYIEQQTDHSYKTLTEVIKPKETGINSNLVYCSKNDRIYGITSPNDFVLFQFAKDISLYIEDVYFQDRNCVQILDECAKACGFIICMDNFGKLYFVSREYFSRMYPDKLDEDSIIDLQTRQASYEFGDRYDVITVQYPNGEEAIGEGRLKYTIGSSVISSRGWARTLANFSYDYLSQDKQSYIVKTKAFYDLWLLNNINLIFPEKSISALTKVHNMTLNPADLTLEITTREVKTL